MRFMPPVELPLHTNEISFVNTLMIDVKLWLAGIQSLTLEMEFLNQWEGMIGKLLRCRKAFMDDTSRHQEFVTFMTHWVEDVKRVVRGEAQTIPDAEARLEHYHKVLFWNLHDCHEPGIKYGGIHVESKHSLE